MQKLAEIFVYKEGEQYICESIKDVHVDNGFFKPADAC